MPNINTERLANFWCGCDPRNGDRCPEAKRLASHANDIFLPEHLRVAEVCLGLRQIEFWTDIPQHPQNRYEVHVEWKSLASTVEGYLQNYGLDLEPRFQRGHVWTKEQQVAYIESMLQGYETSRIITFNDMRPCPRRRWPCKVSGVASSNHYAALFRQRTSALRCEKRRRS